MKKSEVKVGGHYLMRVSGSVVTVRVDSIKEVEDYNRRRKTIYHCTNLRTGKACKAESAAKFRGEARPDKPGTTLEELRARKEKALREDQLGRLLTDAGKLEAADPTTAKRICSWCEKAGRPAVMAEGTLPPTHGICDSCKAEQMAEAELASPGHKAAIAGSIVNEELFAKFGCRGFWAEHPEWATLNPATLLDILRYKTHKEGRLVLGKVYHELERRMQLMEEGEQSPPFPTVASALTPASSPACAVAKPAAPSASTNGTARTAPSAASPIAKLLRKAVDLPESPEALAELFGRVPTEEQLAILRHAVTLGAGDVLVIEAGAGCGKTSTDVMLEKVLRGQGQYTAFNKSLVTDSKTKFKKAKCNTTHSLAFGAVGKRFAHRLDGQRVRSEVVAQMLGLGDLELEVRGRDPATGEPTVSKRTLAAGFLAAQVMQAVRRFCQSADRHVDGGHFKYLDGLDLPTPEGKRTYSNNQRVREHLQPFAAKAWADLSNPEGTLPYNADCYVKAWQLDKPIISADYILLDEHQDTAEVLVDILKQQRHALVILVGDDAQRIYEWRGAINAAEAFPDAPKLFLSQSFRFGPAIAAVANQILERVGTPLRLKGFAPLDSKVEPCADPTAILCRTNAVAVGRVLSAITEGKRPFLVGGGSDVVTFVKGAQQLQQGKSTSHPDLACFASWTEVEEYASLDEGEELRLWVKLINSFGCGPILEALERMPAEKDADLVVCTAHKSKGREWGRVKLAADFPTLSKCCDADFKLLYVACTRAQLVLDISECPFFTGEDAMEVIPPPRNEAGEVLPPTPAAPPARKPAEDFSWAKSKEGGWCIRGPQGHEGKSVKVMRRDGSGSHVRLGKVLREFDDACLYEKA